MMFRFAFAWLLLISVATCGSTAKHGTNAQNNQDTIPPLRLASVFRQVTVVRDESINEISGMVPSSDGRGVWVLNDSGGKDELYLLDRQGKCIQTAEVKGAKQRDWEDLARFKLADQSYLLIADTGNNQLKERTSRLIIVGEPEGTQEEVDAKVRLTINLRFPKNYYDCESVAVSGTQVILATKASAAGGTEHSSSLFFELELPAIPEKEATVDVEARLIGEGPLPFATAMDTNAEGTALVVRDYLTMATYQKEKSQEWRDVLVEKPSSRFPGPFQKQAESVCFSDDGQQIWTVGEGVNPTWWSAKLKSKDGE